MFMMVRLYIKWSIHAKTTHISYLSGLNFTDSHWQVQCTAVNHPIQQHGGPEGIWSEKCYESVPDDECFSHETITPYLKSCVVTT